jgi:hypothetical protein
LITETELIKRSLVRKEKDVQSVDAGKKKGKDSDDETETIVTDPMCLSFTEKAYLAFFIYFSTKRIQSLGHA